MIQPDRLLKLEMVPLVAAQNGAAEKGGCGCETALRLAQAGRLPAKPTLTGGWSIAKDDLAEAMAILIAANGAGPSQLRSFAGNSHHGNSLVRLRFRKVDQVDHVDAADLVRSFPARRGAGPIEKS